MMTFVWIFLWLVVAVSVLGFLGWSANVLLSQKKAWREFALKYKLNATEPKKFMDPVSVTGAIHGRRLGIYPQIEQGQAERMQRSYTHIEVFLNTMPPGLAFIAKKTPPAVLGDITLPETFHSPSPDWPSVAVSRVSDSYGFANWMTPRRMAALKKFMDAAGRGCEAFFACDGDQAFLLWRTEDPLRDPRALNAQVQKMFELAKELDRGEADATPA